MRFISFIFLLAGLALTGAYPWYINNFSGREIGTVAVYERSSGFKPVTVRLAPEDDPIRVLVDLTSAGPANFSGNIAVLKLTASTGGKAVLTDNLSFSKSVQRDQSPQQTQSVFRAEAGLITPVENVDYVFNIGPGDAAGINFSKVELILRANAGDVDPRAQPIGIAIGALGLIGLVVGSKRKRDKMRTSLPPRWGRDGGA